MQEDRWWGLAGEGLGLNPGVLDASEASQSCVCVLEGTELMRMYLCESREAAGG